MRKATGEFTPSTDLERNEPLPCPNRVQPERRLPRPVGPNEQFTASLFLNTHCAKPMKETQKRAGTFNIYLFTIGRETQSRVIRISNANNVQQKALNNSTYQTGPQQTHTPPQEMVAAAFIDTPSSEGR